MLTALETMLTYIVMRVLPTPRCAALMHSVSALSGSTEETMVKYVCARSTVSSFAPASHISGRASGRAMAVTTTPRPR